MILENGSNIKIFQVNTIILKYRTNWRRTAIYSVLEKLVKNKVRFLKKSKKYMRHILYELRRSLRTINGDNKLHTRFFRTNNARVYALLSTYMVYGTSVLEKLVKN